MIPEGPVSLERLEAAPKLTFRVPGSKSITNRALVLAALSEGRSTLHGVLQSDDTLHMKRALEALGISVTQRDETTWLVDGGREKLRPPEKELYVGNSGTTVRFLAALAALVPGSVTLVGDEHMARRPIEDLVSALRQLGVRASCPSGCPPLTITGGRLPGGEVSMRGDRSSQYFSALMLSGSHADGPLRIRVEGELVSRPYVEITRHIVSDFGGRVDAQGDGFVVLAPGRLSARRYDVEPDASSASYPFALAAALPGAEITVPGLSRSALQGDIGFVDVLAAAGAGVRQSELGTCVQGRELRGQKVDMHHISDTVMTLAAIAPVARGPTEIVNVANIRIKETDRLRATATELERLGQTVHVGADWLRIEPRPLRPARVHCYGDHRMAMSFAVLGLLTGGVSVGDPACVAKTYPGFWRDFRQIYRAVGQRCPY